MVPPAHITECPRDALQGLAHFVPTEEKIAYLNALLQVGFPVLDAASFVSPKAIPQMRDAAEVLHHLDRTGSDTRILSVVVNARGAQEACAHPQVDALGYPFALADTCQQRNSKKPLADSWPLLQEIQALAAEHGKTLKVYLSMGFGNPYGDPWSPALVSETVERMAHMGIRHLLLADTVGNADPADVQALYETLIPQYPDMTFGAHFHSTPQDWRPKVAAAWAGGCRHYDAALQGYGGCPFAEDDLVGNLATEHLMMFLEEQGAIPRLDPAALRRAQEMAPRIFQAPHPEKAGEA